MKNVACSRLHLSRKKKRGGGIGVRAFPPLSLSPLSERLEQAISQRTRTETLAVQAITKGSFGEPVMVIPVRMAGVKRGRKGEFGHARARGAHGLAP